MYKKSAVFLAFADLFCTYQSNPTCVGITICSNICEHTVGVLKDAERSGYKPVPDAFGEGIATAKVLLEICWPEATSLKLLDGASLRVIGKVRNSFFCGAVTGVVLANVMGARLLGQRIFTVFTRTTFV